MTPKRLFLIILLCIFTIISTTGCKEDDDEGSVTTTPPTSTTSDTKTISTFSFSADLNEALSSDVSADISTDAITDSSVTNITGTLPYGTDTTALIATFTTTGESVSIGETTQVSGTTANDFSNALTYRVTAEDDSTRDYSVSVTVSPSDAKEITTFSFTDAANTDLSVDVTASISGTDITATVPYGTNVSALVGTFTTNGSSVSVGGATQESGTTANDFSSAVIYTVTAADSSTQDYTVTVAVTLNSAKTITAFSFTDANATLSTTVTASINGMNIAATVPYGTTVSALVATFTTTGSSVSVGGNAQTSGTTANDFSSATTYTVTAANGLTQDYTISVSNSIDYTAGSISFSMVSVPGKMFKTGVADDGTATITNPYLIAKTEVTYKLWLAVYTWATSGSLGTGAGQYTFANTGTQGNNGSQTDLHPVTAVNWRDVMVWMNALTEYYNSQNGVSLTCVYHSNASYTSPLRNSSDGSYGASINPNPGGFDDPYVKWDATGFRLLTSDEWGLAARYINDANSDGDIQDTNEYYPGNYASGADAQFDATTGGSDIDGDIDVEYSTDVAVFSVSATEEVNNRSPNALGLYDISGNVWEWVFDLSGAYRLARGGGWPESASNIKIGYVFPNGNPYDEGSYFGFRIAKTP